MIKCEYSNCDDEAEFRDSMGVPICGECKELDIIENGNVEEDFEAIEAESQ